MKRIVALACSTGGPQALHKMLPMLPDHLGVPMVILQHMPSGFTRSLADRLNNISKIKVKEVEDKEELLPDVVYIAQGGRHFEIVQDKSGKLFSKVYDGPPVNNLKPNADVMYESLLDTDLDEIICVVLTGMGSDGTKGIASLKEKKNIYCITEHEDTCVVYGMPKAVNMNNMSDEIVPITKISESITMKLGV